MRRNILNVYTLCYLQNLAKDRQAQSGGEGEQIDGKEQTDNQLVMGENRDRETLG